MSLETTLHALFVVRCARTFQTVARGLPARPYVVWQLVGGRSLRTLENTAMDKRNVLVQLDVWADKASDAFTLIRQYEEDLCASATLTVDPLGEAQGTYDEQTKYEGALQRFSIYAART